MAYALSHEFTHFVEEMSPQKFRAFTDVLFAEMGKSQVDVKSLIDGKMAALKARNEGLSESELRSLAYSEVAAEMMETAMTDTDVLARISAKIKKTDSSLWGKIRNFLQGLVEKLKSAYKGLNPDSAIARLAKETIASSEAVLEAFSDAAADAVMNYQLQDGQKNTAPEGGRFSTREQTQQEITKKYQTEVDGILSMQDTTTRQLIVGYTPGVYGKLGMPLLPLTIGSGHVYSAAKTEAEAKQDGNFHKGVHYHGLGETAIKNIYSAIQDPVMVIAAKDVNKNASPMRSTHSVVAIVDIGTPQKSLLVPIEITAEREVNGTQMDVNTISSIYEKSVGNLVNEAIALENSGDIGIFYAKKEALTLPVAGVQFPVQLQQPIASDGIVHRLSEKVNMKISEVTQSQQFKRWFGDWQNDPANASKVVNADGTPKVMYHGTDGEFTVFDRSKGKKKVHLNVFGDGNYFTALETGAARYGKNVMGVYLDIKNPYISNPAYNTVADQMASDFGLDRTTYTGKDVSSMLKARGYDGVLRLDENGGVVIANAFDQNQIKSATDNVGTFDRSNPDIRYSSRVDSVGRELSEGQAAYFANSEVRDEDGKLIPVYHSTGSEFYSFDRNRLGETTLGNASDASLAATALVGHWFSDHDLGNALGDRTIQSYLNIENPYTTDLDTLAAEIGRYAEDAGQMQADFEDGDYTATRQAANAFVDWLRENGYDGLVVADTEFGGNSYVVLDSEQAKLTTNRNPTGSDDIRYSLRNTTDGRTAAVVDEDILSGIDLTQWNAETKKKVQTAARDALKKFSDGIVVDGITRSVNRTTLREYTRSNYSENLAKNSPSMYADKMRAASVAGDMVVASTDWARDGKLVHPRTDNFTDFDHGNVLIEAGENQYSAEVIVGITRAGNAVFYDVVDIQPAQFTTIKEESSTTATTNKSPGDIHEDSSGNRVPQSGANVKENLQYSTRQTQEVRDALREYRRQRDLEYKTMEKVYESQLKQVEQAYRRQAAQLESEYSGTMAQVEDAFIQTVEAYEKSEFRNEHLKKTLAEALEDAAKERAKSEEDLSIMDREFRRLLTRYETSGRNIARLKASLETARKNAADKVERAKRTELRGKTFRAMNAINRMLLNPGKTLYVPDSLQPAVIQFMQGLTGEIQKSPNGTLELRGNLESLQAAYANLANLNKGVISPEIHEGVAAMLSDAMDAIGDTEFKNLNREQLTEVYNAVKSVLHTIRNANKMHAENLRGTYGELADLTYREFSMQESREKVTGALREQADTLSWNMEKPVYAAMRLGSDTMLRLYQNLRSGEDTWARDFREARAYAVGTMAKYNYDKFTDKIVTLTDRNGKKVGLNLEERMSLYAYARREQAVQHLTKGGFVLSSRETRTVKNKLGIRSEQRVSDFNTYVLGEGQAEAKRCSLEFQRGFVPSNLLNATK